MAVHITYNKIALLRLMEAAEKAAAMAVDALKTEVTSGAVMPFDMGDMQNNQTFVTCRSNGDKITVSLITGSPQARRLYYHPEYNFQRGKNANAGGKWLEPWINGDKKDFLAQSFAENFKKEAGV